MGGTFINHYNNEFMKSFDEDIHYELFRSCEGMVSWLRHNQNANFSQVKSVPHTLLAKREMFYFYFEMFH